MDPIPREAFGCPTDVFERLIRGCSDDDLKDAFFRLRDDIIIMERELMVRKGMGAGGAMQNIMDERYLKILYAKLASMHKEASSRL